MSSNSRHSKAKKLPRMNKVFSNRRVLRVAPQIVALLLVLCILAGCGEIKSAGEIVLTTDFLPGEVFRIEKTSCFANELMVYLVNSENQYNTVFPEDIWMVPVDDQTVGDMYKESILARLAQIKAMNILAVQRGLVLSEEDEKKVKAAARDYYNNLTEDERVYLGCDLELIESLYHDFAMANCLYEDITADVNPEISDDEARTITVRTILIKTYSVDVAGNRIDYDEKDKYSALERIRTIKRRLSEGEQFEVLAADYNEDSKSEYSFGRGVMPENFEKAAFALANGEISDVVETEYGYHLIYCVNNFNQEETDNNKIAIVEKRKQEEFSNVYNEFVKTLTSNLNAPLWNSISYEIPDNVGTMSFFDIYDKFFEDSADAHIQHK